MGYHPANLILRFLLEMVGLAALGVWGWSQGGGIFRYLLALAAPLIAALVWGALAVPGDPARSGKAWVPIPGILRLAMELAFFGFAVWGLAEVGLTVLAWTLGLLVLFHYAISYDRILWLVKRGAPDSPDRMRRM